MRLEGRYPCSKRTGLSLLLSPRKCVHGISKSRIALASLGQKGQGKDGTGTTSLTYFGRDEEGVCEPDLHLHVRTGAHLSVLVVAAM